MSDLQIDFGALTLDLRRQLTDQGLHVPDTAALDRLQCDVDAITRLWIRGLLTHSAAHAARKKAMKALKALRPAAITP